MIFWLFVHALAAPTAEPMRLDAGPAGSPVLEGFQHLGADGCEDPRVRWVEPPYLAFRHDMPDALALDGLDGGVLHLDLPAGRWILAAMLGRPDERAQSWAGMDAFGFSVGGVPVATVTLPTDWAAFVASPLYAPAVRPHFRPDENAWDRMIAPAWPWTEATVDVGADGIDVAAFGRPLQALVAWPASQPEAWEVEQTLIRSRRRISWARYGVGGLADTPAPLASPGPLGLALGSLDKIPSAAPGATSLRATLHLARNDRTTRLVTLSGGDDEGRIEVIAPPGLDVRLAEAAWLDTAQTPGRTWGPRPVVLDEGWVWRGGQGTPPVVQLTVATTAATPPGTHTVRLRFVREDGDTAELRVRVQVADVTVENRLPVGLFVQADPPAMLRTNGASPTTTALLDDHLRLLAAHGFDALSLRYLYWPNRYPADANVDADLFLHAVQTWADLGGTSVVWADPKIAWRPAAYVNPDGPVLPDKLVPSATGLLAATARAALPVYVHMWEEEATWKNLGAPPRGALLAERLRSLGPPGLRLFGTLPQAPDWPMAASLDRAVLWGFGDDLVQGITHAKAVGAEAWAYNLTPGASSPLLAWAAGAEGLLQWHANAVAADPYRYAIEPNVTFHTILAPDGTHHATVLLADLADGAADARLLATLEAAGLSDAQRALVEPLRAALLGATSVNGGDGALITAESRWALRAALLTGR